MFSTPKSLPAVPEESTMHDKSYRVALGGIVSALCLLAMFMAGVIAPMYILFPMIAGGLMMIIASEVSRGWAVLTYISVSLMSLIITFDKEAALLFIMFFGHYPIMKFYIDKIRPGFLRKIVKLLIFNGCIILYFMITVYALGLDQIMDEMGDMGKYGLYIMLGAADLIFVLYDKNLVIFYELYKRRLMPVIKRKK